MRNVRSNITITSEDGVGIHFSYSGYDAVINVKTGLMLIAKAPEGSKSVEGTFEYKDQPARLTTESFKTVDEGIEIAKLAISDFMDQASRKREEEWYKTVYSEIDGDYPEYEYKGHTITLQSESDLGCPWREWDCMPTAVANNRWGRGLEWYGDDNSADLVRGVWDNSSFDWDDFAIRYVQIVLKGVAESFSTQSSTYVGFYTGEQIEEWFSGDYLSAERCLKGDIEVFKQWADYGSMLYTVEKDGEFIDAVGGYYETLTALSDAKDVIDGEAFVDGTASTWDDEIAAEADTELGSHNFMR